MTKATKTGAKRVRCFTDGACSGNPGPGGYAALLLEEDSYKMVSGNCRDTTNNRMELLAVVEGVKKAIELGYDLIEVYADSAYVVNAIEKDWISNWKRNKWKTSKGQEIKNQGYWAVLDKILGENKGKVKFIKVKGHDGECFNEMADKEARRQSMLAKDEVTQRTKKGERW